MDIRVFKNYEELSKAAAELIVEQVKNKANSNLGLATGSTPVGLYNELIKDHKENKTSYKDVQTFNLDEYIGLPNTHDQSYYQFMQEKLFSHIDVETNNIHIPSGNVEDIEKECERYNALLKNNPIDVQILGIGTNGHIGFNEPGTPFESVTSKVELAENTRNDNARFFDSMDEVPTHAISMGIQNILEAKQIVLLASGANKADAIKAMVKDAASIDCPASALQNHANVIVLLDEAAASKL